MIKDRLVSGAIAIALAFTGAFATTSLFAEPTFAADLGCSGTDCVKSGADKTGLEGSGGTDLMEMIPTIINFILYAVGILAVVMVIWGGVQYSTSAGDSSKVTKAKNTILYGLIGMVISVLSYAIVNFVLSKVTGK